jgi:hypothetical protein
MRSRWIWDFEKELQMGLKFIIINFSNYNEEE